MVRACGTYEGELNTEFRWGGGGVEPMGKRALGRYILYGRIILKWIFKRKEGVVH